MRPDSRSSDARRGRILALMPSREERLGPEGPELEWKERLPRLERVAALLAAFANGNGGRLLVGVRDDGSVRGAGDLAATREAIREAHRRLEPRPRLAFERLSRGGRVILAVRVSPSREPVAVVGPAGRRTLYVRDGSSTRRADAQEARALARVERGTRVDRELRELLAAVAAARPKTLAGIARAARRGERATRRGLVRLARAGLALERADGRWWLTPRGHARLGR